MFVQFRNTIFTAKEDTPKGAWVKEKQIEWKPNDDSENSERIVHFGQNTERASN